MKLKDLKHNHSLTDLLKILIFSILMITPLLSVTTRCLYVICNKNAYQSYYGETINEKNTYNSSVEDLKPNIMYYGLNTQLTTQLDSSSAERYEIILSQFYYEDTLIEDAYKMYFYGFTNEVNFQCIVMDINSNRLYTLTSNNNFNKIRFTIIELVEISTRPNWLTIDNLYYYFTYNDYSYIDNVFEYSVNKLAESPILSWTQQTAIYTGVNTMTTQLGVTTPTIAMLIVYWFLLTVIYIIIDIIIKVFTWLTHMIGNKSV